MDTRLLLIAVFPGIALAIIAYFADKYDREPLRLLVKLFLLGFISVIPTAFIEYFLISINPFAGAFSVVFVAFVVAGFTEEFMKRHIVIRYALRRPEFNEKLDGIIYAVFVSLGFATAENINYVAFAFASNPYIGLFRGVISVPAHMLFAITMGYYLSMSKYCLQPAAKKNYLNKALYVPMLLHGTFDYILMSQVHSLFMIFVPFVIYLWVSSFKKLNIYYKESKNGR